MLGERKSLTKEASFFRGGRVDIETAVDMDVRCSENFLDLSLEVVINASLKIEDDLRAACEFSLITGNDGLAAGDCLCNLGTLLDRIISTIKEIYPLTCTSK